MRLQYTQTNPPEPLTVFKNFKIRGGQTLSFDPGAGSEIFYTVKSKVQFKELQNEQLYIVVDSGRQGEWWIINFLDVESIKEDGQSYWNESVKDQGFPLEDRDEMYSRDSEHWLNDHWSFWPMEALPVKSLLQPFFKFYDSLKI